MGNCCLDSLKFNNFNENDEVNFNDIIKDYNDTNVKEDVKEEVKEDVKEDVKEEVKEDVKEEIKEEIKGEVKEEVKEEYVIEIKYGLFKKNCMYNINFHNL